jgi:hypothetical protein
MPWQPKPKLAGYRSSRCLLFTSVELHMAGSFLRTSEGPGAAYCDHLILTICRYFHFCHGLALGIREGIEVSAIEQTAVTR